jgi:cobalt-zinc-cadmium efflux system outer membrane protein
MAGGYRAEEDDGVLEFGASAPLPLWDGQDGDILRARFALMKARQERAALEHELLSDLATAAGEHEAAREQLEVVRDRLIPDAARALERTRESYGAGGVSFMDLLDAQRTYTEAQLASLELSLGVATARARALRLAGPGLLDGRSDSAGVEQVSQPLMERP